MIGPVGRALVWYEFIERVRDRWVIVISVLFAGLASAVSLYGKSAGGNAATLAGPSLVTLASLFIPLVALVLSHDAIVGERERNTLGLLLSLPVGRFEVVAAKFLGRGLALVLSIALGLGAAIAVAGGEQAGVLAKLLVPTLLLGLVFLSLGVLVSSLTSRTVVAASTVIVLWFGLVFFYDLLLLALLVITDGDIGVDTIAHLVEGNPTGLYRLEMMERLAGGKSLETLGGQAELPTPLRTGITWLTWIVVSLLLSGWALARRQVAR
ncbi:MAG: ABC transporter permease subunit [Proteobacteria bacterium]|nr:ABC transporter permease subunit [Pseudomonadota bacterium]